MSGAPALPPAFFIPEGDAFRATELVRGPWSLDLAHGGPPAALLARAVERVAGPEAHVARFSVEFHRPIPVGAALAVVAAPARDGKKVRVIGATLALAGAGGKELARATAVCIRRAAVELPAGAGAGEGPGRAIAGGVAAFDPDEPDRCEPFAFPFFPDVVGYHTGIEMRRARGALGRGAMACWMRVRGPIVAGEEPSPLQRVAAVADSGNGVSFALDTARYTFVNPDLTIYLFRPPAGEWVCLDATTTLRLEGVGLAEAALYDERGPIGRSLQSLLVEGRE